MINQANIELHFHPYLDRNTFPSVVRTQVKRGIDVLALEAFNQSIHRLADEMARYSYPSAVIDPAGIRLPDGRFVLNAREYDTREKLHLLTVGYSIDSADTNAEIKRLIDTALENRAFVVLDHPFVDNGNTMTGGHISQELEQKVIGLCEEYSGQIALEWNGYSHTFWRWAIYMASNTVLRIRAVNHAFLRLSEHYDGRKVFDLYNLLYHFGHKEIAYYDVNKKVEELSFKLLNQGYNVPVVADTDVHARGKSLLNAMGSSRIIATLQGETARDIVASLKQKVFGGDYQNVRNYAGSFHLIRAFFFPMLFPGYFEKPRA